MKITFVANSLGHIQYPFCEVIYKILGDDFKYIETVELSKDRKDLGVKYFQKPYLVKTYESLEMKKLAFDLCNESDIVIFSTAPFYYIKERIKSNKLTIYYSERLFKKGFWRVINPITYFKVYKRFVKPSKKSNVHLLCASAYAPLDFSRVGAFTDKIYKWGYQPSVSEYNIDDIISLKSTQTIKLLWVGRLVKLKHCDDAIKVVKRLKDNGYDIQLDVIGTGEEESNLKQLAKELNAEDTVTFLGNCVLDITRKAMEAANIFLFTSDFGEGWGATLNEAMNSGCACVASHGAGSTPFLVDDGVDALIYQSGNVDDLYNKTKKLVENKSLREKMGRKAYLKITEHWNIKKSTVRFLEFVKELKEKGKCDLFKSGPCSKAEVINHHWYK
jgi:glycosyltransferase involved in cell wall biosynthesis